MNKKERFMEYIVNDMISKTDVTCTHYDPDISKGMLRVISVPSDKNCKYNVHHIEEHNLFAPIFMAFYKHIESMYGVNIDDYDNVWVSYRERLLEEYEKG